MIHPEPIQEAEREKEVRQALILTDKEKLQMRDRCEWGLKRIEDVVQQALFDKTAPLLLKMWKEIDRQDEAIERLKMKVKKHGNDKHD